MIWEADIAQYTNPDVFVALDESAVDNKTLQQEYGRSLIGIVLFLPRPRNHVRKLLCNLRSFNYRRVHSTRRSKPF